MEALGMFVPLVPDEQVCVPLSPVQACASADRLPLSSCSAALMFCPPTCSTPLPQTD